MSRVLWNTLWGQRQEGAEFRGWRARMTAECSSRLQLQPAGVGPGVREKEEGVHPVALANQGGHWKWRQEFFHPETKATTVQRPEDHKDC